MKVKELAEIFKENTEELLKLLKNVGVKADAETNIDKDLEKKLAKRYGVPYPFKKPKPAPGQVFVQKVEEIPLEKPQPAPKPKEMEKLFPKSTFMIFCSLEMIIPV